MVKKTDLKTLHFIATQNLTNFGLEGSGASAEGVPENMKRYVYYAKYCNPLASAAVVTIFETIASGMRVEDQQVLTQYKTKVLPEGKPNPETPIMTFRGSGFLAAQTSSLTAGVVASHIPVVLRLYDELG